MMSLMRFWLSVALVGSLFGGGVRVALAADPACADPYTAIASIQGIGATTPISGTVVTTQGVVVGDFEGPSPALSGFYIQSETPDGNPITSEGLFIYNGSAMSVTVGQRVRVTGTATEFQGLTELNAVSAVLDCDTATLAPTDLTLPVASSTYLERYEGMLVRFQQPLYVTESYQLGRFGQVILAPTRLRTPTDVASPGSAAVAVAAANELNQIVLDDPENRQNPDPILFARGGVALSATNTLRGGDRVEGVIGVLTYGWAGIQSTPQTWRLRPVGALGGGVPVFNADNARPAAPAWTPGANLRVVGANVLNYFNQFSGCTNGVGGAGTACRGASNQAEFDRQADKIVAGLLGLEADVIGISEMQNNGYGPTSAIRNLVDRLNAVAGAGTYAFIDVDAATGQTDALGTDAIKVGFLYRPGRVTVVGQPAALNTGALGLFQTGSGSIQRNRPALAATFEVVGNGARLTVAINHLKSKGSDCDNNISPVGPDPDINDGQGNCNLTRTAAAQQLATWLATAPTGIADADVLIIGDMNSYRYEDPITSLTAAGYQDLIDAWIGADAYSYVFDGAWGYLDHALASGSLAQQVVGVGEWHINADEPSVLDYNLEFKSVAQQSGLYAADMYRASDHDPVYVDLALEPEPMAWSGSLFLTSISRGEPVVPPAPTSTPTSPPAPTAPAATPTATSAPGGSSLVIDQLSGTTTPEFVIVRNVGSSSQDMSGWSLFSVVGSQNYAFPGFTLAAGASVRVESASSSGSSLPTLLVWTSANIWNNTGDKAELRQPGGAVVDSECYGNACP